MSNNKMATVKSTLFFRLAATADFAS